MTDQRTVSPRGYRLRRSRRARRLRIEVSASGRIEVIAPVAAPTGAIETFVEQSRGWIERQARRLERARAGDPNPERIVDGAKVLFRGQRVPVTVADHPGRRPRVRFDGIDARGFEIALPLDLPAAQRSARAEGALVAWLKRQAGADAEAFVVEHGARHGLVPRNVRIKDQKRLWGSCTARGEINLNWRLVMAPPRVFAYVVVHELCHLRERHHQPPFWNLVAEVMPDYAAPRRWLRDNGARLRLIASR